MQVDTTKPLDKLTRLTPDFFYALARKGRDRTWYLTPSWVTNGFFLVLRARLPFELSPDLERAGVELAEMFGPSRDPFDVRTQSDEFIQKQVFDKYSEPDVRLLKSQLLSFNGTKKKLWFFRGGNAWALIDPYFVTRFQLKVIYGQKLLFNGAGTLLRYYNIFVCPVGPMKVSHSEAANMTADDYLKNLAGTAEENIFPLCLPRRVLWKGALYAE